MRSQTAHPATVAIMFSRTLTSRGEAFSLSSKSTAPSPTFWVLHMVPKGMKSHLVGSGFEPQNLPGRPQNSPHQNNKNVTGRFQVPPIHIFSWPRRNFGTAGALEQTSNLVLSEL